MRLQHNDLLGMRPRTSIRLVVTAESGHDEISCSPIDCREFIEEDRNRQLGEGDAEAIYRMFFRMQRSCLEFFYENDTDNEGLVSFDPHNKRIKVVV